jgi:hypothetical protein
MRRPHLCTANVAPPKNGVQRRKEIIIKQFKFLHNEHINKFSTIDRQLR